MQKKILSPLFIALFIGLCSFTVYQFSKNQILLDMLMSSLNQAHYSPLKIDDEFSEKAFTLYLKRLDNNKKFFILR